jgi:uncharacterized C2H2 Zn-finger protein
MEDTVFECPRCGYAVATEEVARYDCEAEILPNQVVIGDWELDTEHEEFVVRRCPRCRHPFLHRNTYMNHHEAGTYLQEVDQLYPAENTSLLSQGPVPSNIKKIFTQAKSCYSKSLHEPAVIMCRKCLEAICEDLGAKGKHLAEKVESLNRTQTIDARLYSWATQLRLIGNDAAHDLTAVISRRDAEDSLAFLNALLLYIYTLEKKFSAFLKRRRKAQLPTESDRP